MRKPVNRYAQKNSSDSLQKRLLGQQDPRGPVGMFSRGKNVYGSASTAAHKGGGQQFGRPSKAAILRRLRRK